MLGWTDPAIRRRQDEEIALKEALQESIDDINWTLSKEAYRPAPRGRRLKSGQEEYSKKFQDVAFQHHLNSFSSKFYDKDFQSIKNIPTHHHAIMQQRQKIPPMIIGYKNSPYSVKKDKEHTRTIAREFGRRDHRLKKKPYRIDSNSILTHKVMTDQLKRRKNKKKGKGTFHLSAEPRVKWRYTKY